MNINDLTIGQAKELAAMFSSNESPDGSIYSDMIGNYVIVRSRNEGINAGLVTRADETGIVLKEARRLWYHQPKDKSLSWYEGVAVSGVSSDSKLSGPVPIKAIIEDYSVTFCTPAATTSIKEAATNEQS